MIDFIIDYWWLIVIIGDAVAGHIPDRYVPYAGIVRRILVGIKNRAPR